MGMIFAALAIGVAVGWFNLLPQFCYRFIDKLMLVVLFLLIFSLALGVGSDQAIFDQLASIGLSSFLMAAAAIAGSVLCLWLVQNKWFREEK